MYSLPSPYELRPVTPEDQDFLDALYASSREDLQALVGNPAVLVPIMKMQQRAQELGFQSHYPQAEHWLLQSAGQPLGRLVLDWTATDLRVVDIAITPAHRRQGAARTVLLALQELARQRQVGMSLSVAQTNYPAQSLYQSLGFVVTSQDVVLQQRAWKP